jgi:hypothetical protein
VKVSRARIRNLLFHCAAETTYLVTLQKSVYYRRAITIPFINELLNHLERRFSAFHTKTVSAVKRIVPAFVCTSATMEESGLTALDESIPNDFEYYLDDLPTADGLPMEVDNWTNKWRRFKGNLPDNPADCLSHAAPAFYANIHCLLRIFCTLPDSNRT